MEKKTEIVGRGRGLSIRNNLKVLDTDSPDNVLFEFYGEPKECVLVLVSGIVSGDEEAKIPFLVYPNGWGEIALLFEMKNDKGEWEKVDLVKLIKGNGNGK